MIRETLGEDLQGFARLWERIRKDSRDFRTGFLKICETFGRGFARIHKDSQGLTRLWKRIHKDSGDFGRGFARITEDLQGFVRLWERIRKDL